MNVNVIQQGIQDMDMSDGSGANTPLPPMEDGRKLLDLVFIQDATGSQGSYISSATKNIEEICNAIFASGKLLYREDLRVGLISFRDHPPQDHTYITKNFGFSSDIKQVHENLKTLFASGGGDGPEAVTAALGEALEMDWRPTAAKMIVLIADAPPHGIGEYGDGFDEGSPDGRDPLVLARQMAQRGITLFFVACEPALSGYQHATDFYQALTGITSGLMLPLTTANLLAHAIIGSVLENLDMERLIREVGQAVAQRILGGNESVDDVARELHERLLLRNESTQKLVVENIYRESPEATHNVQIWSTAPDVPSARPHLKKVKGTRFTDKYLQTRYNSSRYYTSTPAMPARSSPARATSPSASTSPSRKIVSSFPAFGASPSTSVFGTAIGASPPTSFGGGTFGGGSFGSRTFGGTAVKPSSAGPMRGGSRADDDDDEDDQRQKIELVEDSITFDQARRITLQSAWRSART